MPTGRQELSEALAGEKSGLDSTGLSFSSFVSSAGVGNQTGPGRTRQVLLSYSIPT